MTGFNMQVLQTLHRNRENSMRIPPSLRQFFQCIWCKRNNITLPLYFSSMVFSTPRPLTEDLINLKACLTLSSAAWMILG
jgi:hypothetical protein